MIWNIPRIDIYPIELYRSSRQEVFFKKVVLRNFTKITRIHKKRDWHSCFPVNFAKFLRTPFSYRTPPPVAVFCYKNMAFV